MNGAILLGSKDSTNTRIENTLGENICLLFGQSYHEMQMKKYQQSQSFQEVVSHIIDKKTFGGMH